MSPRPASLEVAKHASLHLLRYVEVLAGLVGFSTRRMFLKYLNLINVWF